jgi:NAD(P)-dependent dehydrogenase (short-subunit alcohol dehydrogenase family)
LSDPKQISEWLQHNHETPNLLVCNAGVNEIQLLENYDEETFRKVFDTNLTGHLNLTLGILPQMIKNRGGRIIFISSAYSSKARAGRFPYSASKSALNSFMRNIAIEYAHLNILTNAIAPGFIETDLTKRNNSSSDLAKITERIPLGKLGTSEDVARLVEFLGSDSNKYITGQVINVDGGFSIL